MTGGLYVANRHEWRTWLRDNHDSESEVWLIFYRMHTGKPSIPYDDAVEEALCFGWVDSIIKKLDDEKFARKFTPRKDNSRWSESNKKRAENMIRQGKMTEAGLTRVREAKESGEWSKVHGRGKELVIPSFIEDALAQNKKALVNFNNLANAYKRNLVGWVSAAKREETRRRRLAEAMGLLEQNKRLGLK